MASSKHHHVYVIELSKEVLLKSKFKKCNPKYITGKPCVYIGMTGLDPDLRFDKHKQVFNPTDMLKSTALGYYLIYMRDLIQCHMMKFVQWKLK